MSTPLYFDNNATTALSAPVLEATLPYLQTHFGNPSSPHSLSRAPALAIAKARLQLANLLQIPESTMFFTSGGTESNAMALHAALAAKPSRREIIISAVEHASVWAWQKEWTRNGYTVHVIPLLPDGDVDLLAYARLLSTQTALVSVMLANNETGIIYPVQKLAEMAHQEKALFHTDASQAVGKIPVDLSTLKVDYASVCGHKFHAMKGIGCLYVRKSAGFSPMLLGGEQEAGIRPGTEPVAQIVSLGAAAASADAWLMERGYEAMEAQRDAFEQWLVKNISGVMILGHARPRLPNTTQCLIDDIETEPLLALLDMGGVACSSGSACASGVHEPSHVLTAMGVGDRKAAVVRISASRFTAPDEYEQLKAALADAVKKLRRKK